MHKIVTPVSHLFFNKSNADKISKYSDYLEIRERTLKLDFKRELFFHCDADITLPWTQQFKLELKQILNKKNKIKYISFQSTRCCEKSKIINKVYVLSGKKYKKKEMFFEAKKNINWLRKNFGNKLLIGLENNNYYPTEAYDFVTDGDFIDKVVRDNKLFFLFDLAHAQVTASNKKINFQKYVNSLPMDLMLQMHICRPLINHKISRDMHYLPNNKMFKEIKLIASRYKNLKFFTIEYYKNADKLISVIKELRKVLKN